MSEQRQFLVHAGTTRGDHHRNTNNQDGVTYGQISIHEEVINWGIILDGCSSGLRSEAGVLDALDFFERRMPEIIASTTDISNDLNQLVMYDLVEHIVVAATNKVLGKTGLRQLISDELDITHHPQRDQFNQFIRDFYLFTVFGFVQTTTTTYVFFRGDGAIRINDACTYHPQNNAALYPAYFAIPWSVPDRAVANREMNVWELNTNSVQLVIIGTDSWLTHKALFEHLPDFLSTHNNRWLQRRLIIWSEDDHDPKLPNDPLIQESVRTAFFDDTTALALIAKD